MERLLETVHFKNSRRYPALFRFIVEETLEGRGEFLKERLLGVRVFNRPPDYDTADDPIARVTIAEIRKRIAQYYHEEAHETEMRIELMPGRYEPEFHPRKPNTLATANVVTVSDAVISSLPAYTYPPVVSTPTKSKPRLPLSRLWVMIASLPILTVAAFLLWRADRPSAREQLWSPILKTHQTITFCLPSETPGSRTAADAGILSYSSPQNAADPGVATVAGAAANPSFLDHEKSGENVVFSDVLAAFRISNWIADQKVEQKVRLSDSLTLDDLQQGPTVLIGGLDNQWTLRAVAHLRYRFAGTDQEQYWITDTRNPGKRVWFVDLKTEYPAVKRDFALIARVHDDSTRQVQIIVAGIGMSGTAAAGEFMVDPNGLEELRKRIGPGFRDHDFEAVLGTDVVDGIPGSARIMAVEVW